MSVDILHNQIHIIGIIDDVLARKFIEKFDLVLSDPLPNVELHISSLGGLIPAMEDMLVKIQLSYKPIEVYIHNTFVYSGVASAASVIASFASVKTIDFNATFMIHHGCHDNAVVEKEEDIIFWMEKTELDYDVVDHLLKAETVMDANLASLFGFIDNIRYELYEPIVAC